MKDFLNLSRRETIEEHRKMWNWIADNCSRENGIGIEELKEEYCRRIGAYGLSNHCFCCQYAETLAKEKKVSNFCSLCPLKWGTEKQVKKYFCEKGTVGEPLPVEREIGTGLWYKAKIAIDNYADYDLARKLAKQIAELPERK